MKHLKKIIIYIVDTIDGTFTPYIQTYELLNEIYSLFTEPIFHLFGEPFAKYIPLRNKFPGQKVTIISHNGPTHPAHYPFFKFQDIKTIKLPSSK
jgi:hypothetical protein